MMVAGEKVQPASALAAVAHARGLACDLPKVLDWVAHP